MFYREDASEVVYDVAVIGAGVMGSAAACHIAGKGTKIILVEQVVSRGQTAFFSLSLGREKKGSGTVRIPHSSWHSPVNSGVLTKET